MFICLKGRAKSLAEISQGVAVPVAGEAKRKQRKPSLVLDHPKKKKKDIIYAFKFVFVHRFLGAMGIW